MIKVISVDNMRKSDEFTIKNLASGRELMKRAAWGIFRATDWQGSIAIVSGSGNNGGDGFALALILAEKNIACHIYIIDEIKTADSLYYFNECKEKNIKISRFQDETNLSDYEIVVDCIFGTGFRGMPQGVAAQAINAINKAKRVISADINSGLNGDNGRAQLAVKSDLTVSIGYYKTGHFLFDAKDYIGELKNADIGISLYEKPFYLCEAQDFDLIFTKRKCNTHKGSYGKTVIIGGSIKYSGAVKLAYLSDAALRAGCGLSSVIIGKTLAEALIPHIIESTLFPVPDNGEGTMLFDEEEFKSALDGAASICVGMGWGQGEDYPKILEYILMNYNLPLVIDADGINTIAKMNTDTLKKTNCKVILTPHLKEFSRLSNYSIEEIMDRPVQIAKDYANRNNVILLLKGTTTIITDGEEVLLTDTGTPAMAKGGSGDVLSGIIAGINAFSKESILLNTAAAAYINGKAAEFACHEKNEYCALPSDTIHNIYKAINYIIEK